MAANAFGNALGNKFMDRFFRRVDGVVWDLMTGKVGVKSSDGISTIEGSGDDAQIVVNLFDQFGVEVPAFAQSTPAASVNVGDLIYGNKEKVIGWVIEKKVTEPKEDGAQSTVRFSIMSPDGTKKSWTPPKVSMLGFDSGVMVLRSLLNMLPGGNTSLAGMQNNLLPLIMMSGGDSSSLDLDSIMPMMLFSATNGTGDANSGMGNMMQMMMMAKMMGGKGGRGFFE